MDEDVFRRSKTTYLALLIGCMATLAFLAWAAIPDTITDISGRTFRVGPRGGAGIWIMIAFTLVVLAGSVVKLRIARHRIHITDEGISDAAAFRGQLPWTHVTEVSLDGSERGGYRLKLDLPVTAALPNVSLDLDGIEAGPSAVFSAAYARWMRGRRAGTED